MRKLCLQIPRISFRYSNTKCFLPRANIAPFRGFVSPSLNETDRLINIEKHLFDKELVTNQKYLLLTLFNKNNNLDKSKEIIQFLMKDEDCKKADLFPHCRVFLDKRLTLLKENIPRITFDSIECLIFELSRFEEFFDRKFSIGFDVRLLELILGFKEQKIQAEPLIKLRLSNFSDEDVISILKFFPLKKSKRVISCLKRDHLVDFDWMNANRNYLDENMNSEVPEKAEIQSNKKRSLFEIISQDRFDTSKFECQTVVSFNYENKSYEAHSNRSKLLMYEVFDRLKSEELKSRFLMEYQKFNELKEFQIENNTIFLDLNLKNKVSKSSKSHANRFANANSELLINLGKILEKELKLLLEVYKDNAEDNLPFVENVKQVNNRISSKKLFYRYAHFITASDIPVDELSLAVAYTTLAAIVRKSSLESAQIPLIKVAFEVGKLFEFSIQSNQKTDKYLDLFNKVEKLEIGASLIDILIKACKKVNFNIIEHDYNSFKDHMVGILRLSDEEGVLDMVTESKLLKKPIFLKDFNMPMMIPPKAWTAYSTGGFYFKKNTVVLQKDYPELRQYIKESDKLGKLDLVYESLDYVGSSAFAINNSVFDVFKTYFNSKKSFLGIPEAVDETVEEIQRKAKLMDPAKKKIFLESFYNKYGLRLYFSNIMSQAEAFSINGDCFYFPHAIDFRGRAYPMTSGISYMGQDCFRGIIWFWEGKKLGKEGLKWLKIQLANVYGLDKLPNSNKIQVVDEAIELIKDSAQNPIFGKGWWKRGDKPWQTLAACIELVKALNCKNPEEFVSHLPVYQDGSCNGLQHYAALGRDKDGGKEVNLIPGTKKEDVYTRVLELVLEKLKKDLNGDLRKLDFILPLVDRQLIKQSVMTSVYGVTRFGMVLQIRSRFDEYYENEVKYRKLDIKENLRLTDAQLEFLKDTHNRHKSAMYVTKLLVSALKDLFKNAKLIEEWLVHVSKIINRLIDPEFIFLTKSLNERVERIKKAMVSVIWTTKIGLPVVQPYRLTTKKTISTPLQKVTLNFNENHLSPVNKVRQRNAIAPNFIHSLDSTHMMLTSLAAKKNNVTFTSVHDSYWTHACSVSKLNVLLREQFVALYLECDIVADLKKEFETRYGGMYERAYVRSDTKSGKAIKLARDKYKNLCKKIYDSTDVNLILVYELDQLNKKIPSVKSPFELLSHYKDQCYYKQGDSYFEYNTEWPKIPIKFELESKFIPILVPFKIPNVPSKGDLEIKNIKESQYFFS